MYEQNSGFMPTPQMDIGYGFQPPPPSDMSGQADLVEKISPAKLATKIEHKLRGEIWDEDKEKWVIPQQNGRSISKPYLNDTGIWRLVTLASAYIDDNTIYSNLTEKKINKIMLKMSMDIIALLKMKYREFEIDKADLTNVKDMVLDTIHFALLRAKDGNERRQLGKNVTEQILSRNIPQEQQQKKGWFSLPTLFRR